MSYLLRVSACLLFVFSSNISATVIFNDRNTDLSDNLRDPTVLPDIGVGSFDIIGHLSSADKDFFTINLVGSQLNSIQLTEWTNTNPLDWWVGVNDISNHFLNESFVGGSISDALQIDTSVSTFIMGTQTGALTVDYTFTIITTPVPIPAAAWLFGSALVGIGLLKKR